MLLDNYPDGTPVLIHARDARRLGLPVPDGAADFKNVATTAGAYRAAEAKAAKKPDPPKPPKKD